MIKSGCDKYITKKSPKYQKSVRYNFLQGAFAFWNVQFQITDDFKLDSFTGSVISYKRQLTEKQANRIGVSFGGAFRDSDVSQQNDRNTDFNLNIGAQYTWQNYIDSDAEVKFYYGYGPAVDIRYQRSEENDGPDRSRKSTDVGIGGIGYAGVEWFFKQSMSIHAEYQTTAQLSFQKDDTEVKNGIDVERTTRQFSIVGNGVLFGVSVYF
jgi:hypothetical protein